MRWAGAVAAASLLVGCGSDGNQGGEATAPPNFILIFADDLGYGDLSSYGSSIDTPNLDGLADEGVRLTRLYSGNAVCTPSRAVLLTGRFGGRQELADTLGGVYWPNSPSGMAPEQITLPEVLSAAGYRTAMVGKWHLGHEPAYLPTSQGFDRFYGLPYSNDMDPLPLMEGEQELEVVEEYQQAELTQKYLAALKASLEGAVADQQPFFIYHPTHLPHVPLVPSPAFAGVSPPCQSDDERGCGAYADVIRELDWSVGEILSTLDKLGVADNTVVIFTSDNGPWLAQDSDGGSSGPLRGGKGSTFEGGFVVPGLVRWPGVARAGAVVDEPVFMTDWFVTLLTAAGANLPDRTLDGVDLRALLAGTGPRDSSGEQPSFVYYRLDNETPGAYRRGKWKYKVEAPEFSEAAYQDYTHGELLFDLEADPGEQKDLAGAHPDVLSELKSELAARDAELKADAAR